MDKETYLRAIGALREKLESNYRKMRHTRDGVCFFLGGLTYLMLMPLLGMVKF